MNLSCITEFTDILGYFGHAKARDLKLTAVTTATHSLKTSGLFKDARHEVPFYYDSLEVWTNCLEYFRISLGRDKKMGENNT